ncbi:MAG: hypothetical protein GY696_39240 [Gammaproteobacteria bacterium]|nr:hypothetical protein [Gammaproteobacteria bacterium]
MLPYSRFDKELVVSTIKTEDQSPGIKNPGHYWRSQQDYSVEKLNNPDTEQRGGENLNRTVLERSKNISSCRRTEKRTESDHWQEENPRKPGDQCWSDDVQAPLLPVKIDAQVPERVPRLGSGRSIPRPPI